MSPSDKPLLNFLVDDALLERIENYRFQHRFKSRSAAIIHLIEWALDKNPAPPGKAKAPRKTRKVPSK